MSDLISREALMKKVRCKRNANCAECDFFTDGDTWCDGEVFGTTIMQMPTVRDSQWISAEDRLPKRGENVLCCFVPYKFIYIGQYQGDKFEDGNLFFRRWGFDKKIERERYVPLPITHWMPLPELPEVNE